MKNNTKIFIVVVSLMVMIFIGFLLGVINTILIVHMQNKNATEWKTQVDWDRSQVSFDKTVSEKLSK